MLATGEVGRLLFPRSCSGLGYAIRPGAGANGKGGEWRASHVESATSPSRRSLFKTLLMTTSPPTPPPFFGSVAARPSQPLGTGSPIDKSLPAIGLASSQQVPSALCSESGFIPPDLYLLSTTCGTEM